MASHSHYTKIIELENYMGGHNHLANTSNASEESEEAVGDSRIYVPRVRPRLKVDTAAANSDRSGVAEPQSGSLGQDLKMVPAADGVEMAGQGLHSLLPILNQLFTTVGTLTSVVEGCVSGLQVHQTEMQQLQTLLASLNTASFPNVISPLKTPVTPPNNPDISELSNFVHSTPPRRINFDTPKHTPTTVLCTKVSKKISDLEEKMQRNASSPCVSRQASVREGKQPETVSVKDVWKGAVQTQQEEVPAREISMVQARRVQVMKAKAVGIPRREESLSFEKRQTALSPEAKEFVPRMGAYSHYDEPQATTRMTTRADSSATTPRAVSGIPQPVKVQFADTEPEDTSSESASVVPEPVAPILLARTRTNKTFELRRARSMAARNSITPASPVPTPPQVPVRSTSNAASPLHQPVLNRAGTRAVRSNNQSDGKPTGSESRSVFRDLNVSLLSIDTSVSENTNREGARRTSSVSGEKRVQRKAAADAQRKMSNAVLMRQKNAEEAVRERLRATEEKKRKNKMLQRL